nr:hypothetical protein [Clostridia bacterium]
MYRIRISGPKKEVLATCALAEGYDVPDIQFEKGTDDEFVLICEMETRYDASPYSGEEDWDGERFPLDDISEPALRDMTMGGELDELEDLRETGLKNITGCLGTDVRMVNIPDDDDVPVINLYRCFNGQDLKFDMRHLDEDIDPYDFSDSFFENPEEYL